MTSLNNRRQVNGNDLQHIPFVKLIQKMLVFVGTYL